MRIMETIKKSIRSWLEIQPADPYTIKIIDSIDFETNAIRNKIWYRGDSNELEQLYSQLLEHADKYKFWASKSTPGQEIRKVHTGLPGLIVKVLTDVVLNDLNDFDFESDKNKSLWQDFDKEELFSEQLNTALREMLYVGDGAWKIVLDTDFSSYPMCEWVSGLYVDYKYQYGRVKEVVFKSTYKENHKIYTLHEVYGYGYISHKLYLNDKEVPLDSIETTKNMVDLTFNKAVLLAVPAKIYSSKKYPNRGGSIFDDGKLDNFDAFDEAWSQWMDALRAGRAKTYIPEGLLPRDPNTGALVKPNAFDNRYIATEANMSEKSDNRITTEQPVIPHDSYLASYVTALDLCLQGIISPSTLGIDVKKLDNAEAQREKEKATLYTRGSIVKALQKVLPRVIQAHFDAYNILNRAALEEVKVDVNFGEYANPSFESQVETVSKAKTGGIMSIEASVDELYGDSKDDEWKKEEVARLKAEQGIIEMEEPALNLEGVLIDDSIDNEPSVQNVKRAIQRDAKASV